MTIKSPFSNIVSLLWNTFVVYIGYTLTRLTFLATNWNAYADTLTFSHALDLFRAGLIFDTSAIIYTNAVVLLLTLFPLHVKERVGYYRVVRWIYVIINSVCLYANLIDCVYFPYTGKRTTVSVFNEFSNEGATNMTKIFAEQFAVNWYLVLLAIALTWALWRLFRSPLQIAGTKKDSCTKQSPSCSSCHIANYYIVNTLLLGVTIPLCVAGMRGGFTTAVRPITISNANQYADAPAETGIILNTPFSLIRTINKKPFVTPSYMSDEEAAQLYSPVHQPEAGAAFRPMNVVVLIMESFSKQHFGFYNQTLRGGSYRGFTPFLDSLITTSALTYQYSYANGRKSIEGMPSTLSSLPNFVEPLFLTPASLNSMSGLARELSEHKGYTSAFFHGAENGSMGFEAFARATGFQHYYGRTEYNKDPDFNGDDDFDGTWAIWDEEFLQFFAKSMGRMQQPFMTAVFTATSHTPFALPKRYKGVFPTGEKPIQECVAYSDHALRHFFATASRQPWFRNTLFVITADHTSNQIDPFYRTSLGKYCVPIILYAPGDSTLHGYDTQRVVEQIDIMPTVLSYLHYDEPYIAFGQDMLQTPADSTFAIHWVPESDGYQFVRNDHLLLFDGRRVNHAYRFRTDSLLQHDVVTSMPADTLQLYERQLKSVIQQYMQRMNNNQLTIPHAQALPPTGNH